MMRGWFLAGVLCFIAPAAANAQVGQIPAWPPIQAIASAPPSFAGLADVVASPTHYWGDRAVSAAVAAAATQPLANLRRSSDSHTCDGIVATDGGYGITANCSTGGDNGTSVATFCASTSCFKTKWYDQGSDADDMVQATSGSQFAHLLTGCTSGSLPCSSLSGSQILSVASGSNVAQAYTVSAVAIVTSGATFADIFAGSGGNDSGFNPFTNEVFEFGGGVASVAATNNIWHALQFVMNGASSAINVDGTDTATGLNPGGGSLMTDYAIGMRNDGINFPLTGKIAEVAIWASALNATQRGNLCHNQFTYWGTPNSC